MTPSPLFQVWKVFLPATACVAAYLGPRLRVPTTCENHHFFQLDGAGFPKIETSYFMFNCITTQLPNCLWYMLKSIESRKIERFDRVNQMWIFCDGLLAHCKECNIKQFLASFVVTCGIGQKVMKWYLENGLWKLTKWGTWDQMIWCWYHSGRQSL